MVSQAYKLLSYNQLQQRLNNIAPDSDRVLLKTIYAGCARVGEIVNHKSDADRKAINSENLEVRKNFLMMHILSEKSGKYRVVPISLKDNPDQEYFQKSEAWLANDIIKNFRSAYFAISTRWAEYKFQKYFGSQHIHWLRHWRATHLLQGAATGVPVPERVVAKIGGWVGTATLTKVYDSSIVEDYLGVDYDS